MSNQNMLKVNMDTPKTSSITLNEIEDNLYDSIQKLEALVCNLQEYQQARVGQFANPTYTGDQNKIPDSISTIERLDNLAVRLNHITLSIEDIYTILQKLL